MATRLKDMNITSVDLVEQGANQEAHITLLKSMEKMEANTVKEILKKSIEELQKTDAYNYSKFDLDSADLEKASSDNLQACVDDIAEQLLKEAETEEVVEEVQEPEEVSETEEEEPMEKELVKSYEAEITELKKNFTTLEKSYEALQKQLDLKDLEEVAKKYEVIGHNTEELAKTLYDLKTTSEDAYSTYLKALDETVNIQEQSGLFKEYGSNLSYTSSSEETVVKGILESNPNMTKEQAVRKAVLDNPELLEEYDEEYFG